MTKQEIKKRLLSAVKNDPNSADIKYVALFGSYVNGTPQEDSDIDVLIDFYPQSIVGLFKYIDIQENLSKALGKKVDLLTPQAISKYFRNQVLQKAEVVYEGWMRNVLIHEYFGVNLKVVWDTCKNDIPALKTFIEKVLND